MRVAVCGWIVLVILTGPLLGAAEVLGVPNSANIVLDRLDGGLDTHLIIGNGDLYAFIEEVDGVLVVGTSKNDVWDLRLETEHDAPLVPLREIERTALNGAEGLDPEAALRALVERHSNPEDSYHRNPYPCPRMTARWVFPLGARAVRRAEARLAAAQAVVTLDNGEQLTFYVHADHNAVIVDAEAFSPGIEPVLDPGIIPPAEAGEWELGEWVVQALPDDIDVPGITFAAAQASRGPRHVLAQATSREGGVPLNRAQVLARTLAGAPADALEGAHRAHWERFWRRSGVCLGDAHLESLWYRQLYFMGTAIRPEAPAPGLFAPITSNAPAWHGDYHTNYNIQQTFWAALAANHSELLTPYDRLIVDYLPRARWLARELYAADGAFYPHVMYLDEPPPAACSARNHRQYIHVVWAYTLGVTAFSVQNLWWRYQYEPDPRYLRRTAYPVLAAVADFYADVLEQYRTEDGVALPPTVSPEHWGWTPGLEKNRNGTFDTAMIAFSLEAAAEAADILALDSDRARRWRNATEWLPPYPTYGSGRSEVVVDIANAEPIQYNIPVPATPVFPGEQVTAFSPPEVQALFTRTIAQLRSNGNNDTVINTIARARLSMPDAYEYLRRETLARMRPNGTLTLNRRETQHRFNDYGHYTEMWGAAAALMELLVQGVGGVIRVLPAWPEYLDAEFTGLRTPGGFLVSAAQAEGSLEFIEVRSTAGGRCRVLAPWPRTALNGARIEPDEQGILAFDTEPGQTYRLTSL